MLKEAALSTLNKQSIYGATIKMALVFLLFISWLPWAGYGNELPRYDAGYYWELSTKFFVANHFSVLNFNDSLRGYGGAFLLLPARTIQKITHWAPLTCTGILGAFWAAILFGWLSPELWYRLTGQRLATISWAVLVALGWLFWREYFLFPLTDAPALVLFEAGLLLLWYRHPLAWLGAGLALGLAINLRPNYQIALPVVGGLVYFGLKNAKSFLWIKTALLAFGVAIALVPQFIINVRYFNQHTPFVIFQLPHSDSRPVFLRALGWGMRVERYESILSTAHENLVVPDSTGIREMLPYGPRGFTDYGQYASFVAQHPFTVSARYLRHTAHTFDLWFATPYPTERHWPGQWLFRLLNYALLGLGVVAIIRQLRRGATWQVWLLYAASALPVLLTIPFHVETRYSMGVHLLLIMGAISWRFWAGPWPLRRIATWVALAGIWLGSWIILAQKQEKLAVFDPKGLET